MMKDILYESELRVLEVLWNEGDITVKDLASKLNESIAWSKTTSYTMIKKCTEKGLVERSGTKTHYMCRALITREEAQKKEAERLADKMFDGSSDLLISSLFQHRSMNIMVINGTKKTGMISKMKEEFFATMRGEKNINEYFLPDAFPAFCIDCKVCACSSIYDCPHSKYTAPLWENILEADLLVFTLPTFATELPGQVVALLNHYYAKFMADVVEANMSSKQGVVLTYGENTAKTKNLSLLESFLGEWGISHIHVIEQPIHRKDKLAYQLKCEEITTKVDQLIQNKKAIFKLR